MYGDVGFGEIEFGLHAVVEDCGEVEEKLLVGLVDALVDCPQLGVRGNEVLGWSQNVALHLVLSLHSNL